MRTISIRQFQQHFHSELASLPFQVTKRGTPVFNVVTIDNVVTLKDDNVVTSIPRIIKTPEEAVEKVKEFAVDFQICKHGARKGLCKFGCV
jgi:antitoxin (DNA-binding transcriptional repressor) of toxin-antitoxin stability system